MRKEELKKLLEPFVRDGTLFAYHELLRTAFYKETFKFLLKIYKNDKEYIRDIKEQVEDINRSFKKGKLKKGFRITKGLMEDIVEFIVFDFNPEIETCVKDSFGKYREYLFKNIPLDSDEDLPELFSILYSYVAKIDHTTSLKMFIKEMEKQKLYGGIEKTCGDLTAVLLMILLSYTFSKHEGKYDSEREFIYGLLISLKYFSTIVATYSAINEEREVDEEDYFKSEKDKEYMEWQKQFAKDTKTELATNELNDPKFILELIGWVESELKKRNYIK